MEAYALTQLSPQLVLIQWRRSPSAGEAYAFIQELEAVLNNAPEPLYFISDLRLGHIDHAVILRSLGQLTKHLNWAGSTAFGGTYQTQLYVNLFTRLSRVIKPEREIWDDPEKAIEYLESLSPGLTRGIDWDAALNISVNSPHSH
ncbi:MAG: hypothetical protein K8L99_30925 [Anaerolineae bacterium]|nr:hypothetical protein [Anaerolineae bacterium]